ncbi:hypothetical protein Cgig2_010813 [Carnegiea gigantea]|uniref:Uncharacterized protein n=1 Tax=Carnegiea gigantea TaxID=171969 RepID=A0A9Q1JQ10_9CARY|nr:hypothetical protein Cgig2_010813 [Carnegiea gigantea]
MLRRPLPIVAPLKLQNARKYCEFYGQNGHTTTECRELKKALHELVDKGQIDQFLKRGPRFLRREQEPAQPQPEEEECSMEVVATIAGGYAEGMTRSAWKAQLRSTQQDCLKKLTHPGGDIVPLVYPILGFDGQEVNPSGSPLSSQPSSSEAPASASKGLVASSPTPSPSPEGGINSTSSGSQPSSSAHCVTKTLRRYPKVLALGYLRGPADSLAPSSGSQPSSSAHWCSSTSHPLEILGPASPRPCADTLRYRRGPADSLAPSLEPSFQPPRSFFLASRASCSAFNFSQHRKYQSPVPPAFDTLPRLSPLERMLLPLSPLPW